MAVPLLTKTIVKKRSKHFKRAQSDRRICVKKHMATQKKDEQSDKRRKTYANMDPTKKAELLKRRRLQYALARSSHLALSSLTPPHRQTMLEVGESSHPASYEPMPPSMHCSNAIPIVPASSTRRTKIVQAQIDPSVYPRRRNVSLNPLDTHEPHCRSPSSPNIGPSVLPNAPDCKYCQAKRFYREPPSFCCAEGEVRLAPTSMPIELLRLFTSTEPDAVQFRRYVRTYNNHLAFTTFGAKTNPDLMKNSKGIYTFSVQGQIYHRIPPLQSPSDSPRNLQLYLYDG